LAINSSGTPYVAYKDGACNGKASVMRFVASHATGKINMIPVYKLLLK